LIYKVHLPEQNLSLIPDLKINLSTPPQKMASLASSDENEESGMKAIEIASFANNTASKQGLDTQHTN